MFCSSTGIYQVFSYSEVNKIDILPDLRGIKSGESFFVISFSRNYFNGILYFIVTAEVGIFISFKIRTTDIERDLKSGDAVNVDGFRCGELHLSNCTCPSFSDY